MVSAMPQATLDAYLQLSPCVRCTFGHKSEVDIDGEQMQRILENPQTKRIASLDDSFIECNIRWKPYIFISNCSI